MKEDLKLYVKGVNDPKIAYLRRAALSSAGGIDICQQHLAEVGCNNPDSIYYIGHDGMIHDADIDSELARVIIDNYKQINARLIIKGDIIVAGAAGSRVFTVAQSDIDEGGSFETNFRIFEGNSTIRRYSETIPAAGFRLPFNSEMEIMNNILRKNHATLDNNNLHIIRVPFDPRTINEKTVPYYFVDKDGIIGTSVWDNTPGVAHEDGETLCIEAGNCFNNSNEAQRYADVFKKILSLDQSDLDTII